MLRLDFRPYRRSFRKPLATAHGLWTQREGIILRFEDDQGQVSFGEIAPLPWFGTETLEQAQAFCQQWPREFLPKQAIAIPDTLPACQFGFNCVGNHSGFGQDNGVLKTDVLPSPRVICALLPAGVKALNTWQPLWEKGHRTFKWKIGVAAIADELALFKQLIEVLPVEARLRLDANGGLMPEEAESWLRACDRTQGKVEFMEQPLPPSSVLTWVSERAVNFETAIALDESVATFQQFQQVYEQMGDRVIYVVKPAILGFSHRVSRFCRQHRLDIVFSSALETPVGFHRAMELAQHIWQLGMPKRAIGFGVSQWFADDWHLLSEAAVWNQL
ncbi:o-succinylbenzoate synthase [Oscillatoria sp. CS-180]|uniref:o-succinylbenzoate synthase n=1 Tax=Oscillatoria sp. CS-180 TaxID=3021720 RepID=UPI002330F0E2|nr:o-succinylbenzoate synthase [Oscillatoria sp. CS-180]MDB9527353.1 o-succinylbenzoate synthase [Oscillatoria sp. CS-180]